MQLNLTLKFHFSQSGEKAAAVAMSLKAAFLCLLLLLVATLTPALCNPQSNGIMSKLTLRRLFQYGLFV
jgi:hypothetical protein